jgi:hypothetical protein
MSILQNGSGVGGGPPRPTTFWWRSPNADRHAYSARTSDMWAAHREDVVAAVPGGTGPGEGKPAATSAPRDERCYICAQGRAVVHRRPETGPTTSAPRDGRYYIGAQRRALLHRRPETGAAPSACCRFAVARFRAPGVASWRGSGVAMSRGGRTQNRERK